MASSTIVETSNIEDDTKLSPKINAFQFMMNSRNKVIGNNSPGKERKEEELKSPEMVEKTKEKLSKRKAIFENWAEKKGGMKRKIADEAAEFHINRTLNKRAKRLKEMLAVIDEELKNSGEETSDNETEIIKVKLKKSKVPVLIESENSSNADDFNEIEICNVSDNGDKTRDKNKTTEDAINSINCSENGMLKENGSVSPRVNTSKNILSTSEKGEKNNVDKENSISNNDKTKMKVRRKSLSLKKSKNLDLNVVENKCTNVEEDFSDDEIFPNNYTESKTPVKNDCIKFTSDLKKTENIKNDCFSPRAWRMKLKSVENSDIRSNSNENSSDKNLKELNDNEKLSTEEAEVLIVIDDTPEKQCSTEVSTCAKGTNETKKQVKLAPIFLKQQQKKMDKASLDAKKNFLHSGAPSQVKKLMTKPKSFQEPEYIIDIFPKISHVQQRDEINLLWDLPNVILPLNEIQSNVNIKFLYHDIKIGSFTDCSTVDINNKLYAPPSKCKNLKQIIKSIKQDYQSYPVYKTFRMLYQKYNINKANEVLVEEPQKTETPKRKRGRPKKKKEAIPEKVNNNKSTNLLQINETHMWTEKYKPLCQEEIVGNLSAVQELKIWLETWIRYSEDQKSCRKRRISNSSDDFCSDSTTKDSDSVPQNIILVNGPLGSGKTSSIYGLCNELNINVIEINASSKRSGKKILNDLQEATQSYQVKNTDIKSATSFFQKKTDSQTDEDVNKKLSLLLFEDVDIVFDDQDENFISALTTLIASSKRPIVLTFTDKKCLYLQKFILQYTVINFNSVSKKFSSPWFQILCLIEGVKVDKNMMDNLIDFNKGDFRKIILQLQFWVQTGGDYKNRIQNVNKFNQIDSNKEICLENEEINIDDDNSNLSWLDKEDNNEILNTDKYYIDSFIPYYERDKKGLPYPTNLELLWWNIPNISKQNQKIKEEILETETSICHEDLSNVAIFLENLSNSDVIHTRLKTKCYEESIYNYWEIKPEDSLSFNENYDMYTETENTSLEITHWIIENSAQQCRENITDFTNVLMPCYEEINWKSKRHKNMKDLLNAVPTFSILDRKAICIDYQTILRNISRAENQRSVTNNKRKNRFYHYFKNFNIHINDSASLLLCNTLATNNVE